MIVEQNSNEREDVCVGTILKPSYVLTLADCVVGAGMDDVSVRLSCSLVLRVHSQNFFFHSV